MNHPNVYLLFNLLRHWKNILQNYIPQRNLIFPVVWKCIISRDCGNVQNKIFKQINPTFSKIFSKIIFDTK